MAYQTGTAPSLQSLMDLLVSFLTSNGWTLVDTVQSPNDIVVKSSGTDGKTNLVLRMVNEAKLLDFDGQSVNFVVGGTLTGGTSGATAQIVAQTDAGTTGTLELIEVLGTFLDNETITGSAGGTALVNGKIRYQTFRSEGDIHNVFDWIRFQGYSFWNAATNTGVNEFSRWGPQIFGGVSSAVAEYRSFRERPEGSATFQIGSMRGINTTGQGAAIWNGVQPPINSGGSHGFDGGRRFYFTSRVGTGAFGDGSASGFFDIGTGETPQIATLGSPRTAACFVYDKVNDRTYIYMGTGSAVLADIIRRYDAELNTWQSVPAPPWAAASPNGGAFCWDGRDFVYAMNGNSTTLFSRLSISGNTWTARAALPTARSTFDAGMASLVYVPMGIVPGATEDYIYGWSVNVATALHRYNVTSNTWTTNDITLPETANVGQAVFTWDHNRYLYFGNGSGAANTRVWKLDLQNIAAGWALVGDALNDGGQYGGMAILNGYQSKVRGRVGTSVGYHFIGDADGIHVVTKIGANYYWAHFGRIDTYANPNVMTLTALANVGSPATVTVNDTSAYVAGESVFFVDPSNGRTIKTSVLAVLSPTQFTAPLSQSFTAGSLVGADAGAAIATGDLYTGIASYDANGFESDGQSASYRVGPLVTPAVTGRSGPTVRQRIQTFPLIINGDWFSLLENRGSVHGAAVVRSTAPAESIVRIGTDQYKVFPLANNRQTQESTRHLILGPIN